MSAIQDLINTLIEHTKNGDVRWEQADARARSFVASRGSGTVVVTGPGSSLGSVGLAVLGIAASVAPKADPNVITLTVRDGSGSTVEEVEYVPHRLPFSTTVQALDDPTLRQLPNLYWLAKEQVTQAEATVRSLVDEFGKPEPKAQ